MKRKVKKNIYIITVVIFIFFIVFIVGLKLYLNKKENVVVTDESNVLESLEEKENEKEEEIIKTYTVDIKGAVPNPGVYNASSDSRVIDIVKMAGGLGVGADTSLINLSKKISDEMVIIIYTKDEVLNSNVVKTVAKEVEGECICPNIKNDACINTEVNDKKEENNKSSSESNYSGLININTATLEELLTLTGIGESKAKKIIEYREKNGNFEKIEDIMNVSGIGQALYDDIKENITV